MKKFSRVHVAAILAFLLATSPSSIRAADTAEEEYAKRLERYDLIADPGDHQKLATWCKRNHPSRYGYHLRQYNKHVFSQLEAKLPASPAAGSYWDLHEQALKLELPDQSKKYHGLWGVAKYAEFEKRLKPGDLTMMKQLFKWCDDQKVTFIEPARKLGEAILEQDPEYVPARQALGHVKWEGAWISKQKLIDETIDIRSVQDRIKAHNAVAMERNQTERTFPTKPFDGMEEVGQIHAFRPAKSPDALFYVSATGYSPRKPAALVLSLHGGGSGGFEKADEYAKIAIKEWTGRDGYVAVAPVATDHNSNSWGTRSNMLEILDALEEICERFNIDRKRIYVTGQSMGGGGTTLWYLCFPEFTAASCGRAGWFHHTKRQPDLLGKPILIIQGEQDRQDRLDSRVSFEKTAEACSGKATFIDYPEVDHFVPTSKVMAEMIPFFENHVNEIEPDFDVIRAAVKSWIK